MHRPSCTAATPATLTGSVVPVLHPSPNSYKPRCWLANESIKITIVLVTSWGYVINVTVQGCVCCRTPVYLLTDWVVCRGVLIQMLADCHSALRE